MRANENKNTYKFYSSDNNAVLPVNCPYKKKNGKDKRKNKQEIINKTAYI